MHACTRLQRVDPLGRKHGEGLASDAARTVMEVLLKAVPFGAKAAPTGINGEDLTITAY